MKAGINGEVMDAGFLWKNIIIKIVFVFEVV